MGTAAQKRPNQILFHSQFNRKNTGVKSLQRGKNKQHRKSVRFNNSQQVTHMLIWGIAWHFQSVYDNIADKEKSDNE